MPKLKLIFTFGLTALANLVSASGPYRSLGDTFQGQLANLPSKPAGNPALGGEDFGWCCLFAVNQSLEIIDGDLAFVPGQTVLHGNMSTFLSYQFPCTASYNGSAGDQPQVTISYSWCHDKCGGWAKMSTQVQSDWIEPLVGYILPTIVFCFSIPRRRAIVIPSRLFPGSRLFVFPENLTLLYKLPAAALLMIFDTLLWIATCIVLSGPMLLSGLLEALLDSKLLRFLSSRKELSLRTRAHLMLVILIGNLDENPAWEHSKRVVSTLEHEVKGMEDSSDASGTTSVRTEKAASADQQQLRSDKTLFNHSFPDLYPDLSQPHIDTIRSRLTALLESQASFATSVGIGVIFFASSFFYGIGSIKEAYGDAGTSHSLAFGCFWMTIGHVAVIAGIVLAGDNPSCWEGIAASPSNGPRILADTRPKPRRRSSSVVQHLKHWSESSIQRRRLRFPAGLKAVIYKPSFTSVYKTSWMWNRGSKKAMWIAKFAEEYDLPELQREVLYMGWKEWALATTIPTILLYVIPTFLGGMASYTTPTVGLSCRSMVPLLYSSTQTLLVSLWLCDWRYWKRNPDMKVLTTEDLRKCQRPNLTVPEVIWYSLFLLSIVGATVFSIGGTTFQLMGLFGNCLCYISIWDWGQRNSPAVTMYLSGNSNEQIYNAKKYWVPIAVSATIFLITTTYFGWQYQHRLRRRFLKLVEGLQPTKRDMPPLQHDRELKVMLKTIPNTSTTATIIAQ